MSDQGWTVGSLYGRQQGDNTGATELSPAGGVRSYGEGRGSGTEQGDPGVEAVWVIRGGEESPVEPAPAFRPEGVEALDYSNPYRQVIEKVWFDGKIVFASEQGELDLDPATNKVAQEYQIVYGVDLDGAGKLVGEPARVPEQYNIYDSVPGMEKYSPIWQFNYVIVPRNYTANTLRSEADCLASGFPIVRSNVFEN